MPTMWLQRRTTKGTKTMSGFEADNAATTKRIEELECEVRKQTRWSKSNFVQWQKSSQRCCVMMNEAEDRDALIQSYKKLFLTIARMYDERRLIAGEEIAALQERIRKLEEALKSLTVDEGLKK